MKLENEPVVFLSTSGDKPVSKTSEFNGNAHYSGGHKSENQIMKESQKKLSSDLNGDEKDSVQLTYLDCSDEFNDCDDEIRVFVAPFIQSSEVESCEKAPEFYMDRSGIECQQSELIDFDQENTCNVVKDICIDDRVPSYDKILFHSSVDVPTWKDQNGELTKDQENGKMSLQGELKPLVEAQSDKVTTVPYDLKGHTEPREVKDDVNDNTIANDISKCLVEALGTENSTLETLNNRNNEVKKLHFKISGEKVNTEFPASISAARESNCGGKETIFSISAPVVAAETQKDNSLVNDSLHNCKDENKTVTSSPVSSGQEESHETINIDSSQTMVCDAKEFHQSGGSSCVESQNSSKCEDTTSDIRTASSQVQQGIGDTSFSAAIGPSPSLINYCGPLVYSGSVSLRSDSSTTSTRSFAFPILQPEWNYSPVKMENAGGKRFRKQRGWRQGLFCCRF